MQDRRRYRFRAWHHSDRRIYPVISISRGGTVVKDDDLLKTCQREDIDLMQYSGLVDTGGREIYESDVVEYGEGGKTHQAVVVFEKGAFSLKPLDQAAATLANLNLQTIRDCRVVGNIYEQSRIGPST